MGICDNRHGKIDQETQSPLLNVFKEIMTREKDDPEKRNLLNEQREDKKRRQYSVSKNKSERRSIETINTEHRKRASHPYKISSTEQRAEFHNKSRSQSVPYQAEKKDSWWFWTFVSQQNTPPAKKSEDTCSCVSCALKKIVSSEYACIGCLLLLFTISIIIAFLVVFKSVPSADCKILECKECKGSPPGVGSTTPKCKECGIADSERLKRKIEMLSNKQMRKGFVGVDEFRKNENPEYNDVVSGQGVAGIAGVDFGPSFRELNSVDESEHKFADLSNVLDPDKNVVDLQSSEKLRDFYKKLVQTDAKIKMLTKKQTVDVAPYEDEDVQLSPERSRRSLKLYHYPTRYRVLRHRRSLFGKHQKVNETSIMKERAGNKTRSKRFGNESEEPTGFIIEKKKVLVQYKPDKKRIQPVKKCQHAPAGTHTHEKQMMHPFYKNTQRLDLLLDKFLNKNLPEIMKDPFGVDDFFRHDNLRKTCKHPKPHKNVNILGDGLIDQIPKPKFKFKSKADKLKKLDEGIIQSKNDMFKMLTPESTTQFVKDFYMHEVKMIGKEKKKIVTSSPSDFEVLLSVSTIMNPDIQKSSKSPRLNFKLEKPKSRLIDRVPNLRRLMQLEPGEEEENLGYEDFKEVLTDDMDNHDEMEKAGDRRRRDNDQPAPALKYQKFNPPQGVHNPNWKGAMPLYQDEINSVINKGEPASKPTDEIQEILEALQRKGRGLSDIEYVEDYLADKYDKLVQQAQAYSDYGVLDGKKESRNEKDSPTADTVTNHKIKLSADENFHKGGLLARFKRGRVPRVVTSNTARNRRRNNAVAKEDSAQTVSDSNSEGIRIQVCPTNLKGMEDSKIDIMKYVSQHVKCISEKPNMISKKPAVNINVGTAIYPHYIHSALASKYPNLGHITTKPNEDTTEFSKFTTDFSTTFKELDDLENAKELLNSITRGNRRLLATGSENFSDLRDYKDASGYSRSKEKYNKNGIDRFVDKLHMKKNFNLTNHEVIQNYIEGVTRQNIRLFSSPPPFDSGDLISEMYDSITEDMGTINADSDHISNFEVGLPDALVTINKSSVKFDSNDNFFGKMLLTVKDPEFGVQNFNLIFDVPLLINFKEELMMMSDNLNYPSVYNNQFEGFTDAPGDPLVTDIEAYPELFLNKTTSKRSKREAYVITPSNNDITKINTEKNLNVTDAPDYNISEVVRGVAKGAASNNSLAPKPVFLSLTAVNSNDTADLNSTLKGSRAINATVAVADNMTLSDFFSEVANWFAALEYGKDVKPRCNSGSILSDMLHILNNNSSNEANISTTDSAYPMYDSDMIENIGHRSRVLLAVNDLTANITEENKAVIEANVTKVTSASTADGNVFNRTTSKSPITALRSNATTIIKNQDKKTYPTPKQVTKQKIKAIVKRNADDSNLIFWNDIYDDEYGIQSDKMDKLDSAVRDKHSVKEKDFFKRSGRWVQNKIRKFANNLKINPHSEGVSSIHSDSLDVKERVARSVPHAKDHGWASYQQEHIFNEQTSRREPEEKDEIEEDYPDIDQKSLFAALSANMKEVCKKAAKAVQQTRSMDQIPDSLKRNGMPDDSKQGSITNALMQQLVRLLTELVDYQVQQKTCRKLPDDLRTFLEWLTYTKEEPDDPESQSDQLFKAPNQEDEELIEQLRDSPHEEKAELPDEMSLSDKQEAMDDRALYLENVHSVQRLLQEYDEMSNDDKSKMTGVKGYLEKQLDMLNRQLSAYDLYNFFEKHDDNDRKKRGIIITKQITTKHRPRRNLNRHKFIRNFGKKHTRTTAGSYHDEANQVTEEVNRKTDENANIMHSDSVKNAHHKLMKRNLKDVYYKAVAEAKKYSTAKNIQKKDEISRFSTSTVMHT
ncbi:hypothetical protein PYW07_011879 [Mythimna separata]|uniref:Uncharacterized protein n=1 Tax=Mythimna separata TaxID=271217 RepID=A0AAD7Y701_MYTSE|nr:hypothetical protein PYW07_011879 [Mythimna separata]